MPYTITIVRGEQPGANGVELDNPNEETPVMMSDLSDDDQKAVVEELSKWEEEFSDAWALVTPAGEHANAVNVLAVLTTG